MILVTIVSVSLNDDILEGIDKLQKTLGFTGRSEIVRAGIRNLLAEERMKQDLDNNELYMTGIFKSYEVGFTRGLASISLHNLKIDNTF